MKEKRKNIMIDADFHRKVKTAAAVRGMSMQDLIKAVFNGTIKVEIEEQKNCKDYKKARGEK